MRILFDKTINIDSKIFGVSVFIVILQENDKIYDLKIFGQPSAKI